MRTDLVIVFIPLCEPPFLQSQHQLPGTWLSETKGCKICFFLTRPTRQLNLIDTRNRAW